MANGQTSVIPAAPPMIRREKVVVQHNDDDVPTIRKFTMNIAIPGVDPPRDKALQELSKVSQDCMKRSGME